MKQPIKLSFILMLCIVFLFVCGNKETEKSNEKKEVNSEKLNTKPSEKKENEQKVSVEREKVAPVETLDTLNGPQTILNEKLKTDGNTFTFPLNQYITQMFFSGNGETWVLDMADDYMGIVNNQKIMFYGNKNLSINAAISEDGRFVI